MQNFDTLPFFLENDANDIFATTWKPCGRDDILIECIKLFGDKLNCDNDYGRFCISDKIITNCPNEDISGFYNDEDETISWNNQSELFGTWKRAGIFIILID